VAGPLEDGEAAYQSGNFAAAAARGLTAAEAVLGVMYSRGFGVPKDDELAGDWLRKAAEQNTAAAPLLASDVDLSQ
jgi:hypothetical protein